MQKVQRSIKPPSLQNLHNRHSEARLLIHILYQLIQPSNLSSHIAPPHLIRNTIAFTRVIHNHLIRHLSPYLDQSSAYHDYSVERIDDLGFTADGFLQAGVLGDGSAEGFAGGLDVRGGGVDDEVVDGFGNDEGGVGMSVRGSRFECYWLRSESSR